MKLNLGCGNVIFPLNRDEPIPFQNHLMPLQPECFEDSWTNVDKWPNPGVAEIVNLFHFPWIRSTTNAPWPDNSIDYIYCGHLVEHIPHEVRISLDCPVYMWADYTRLCEGFNGLYIFFHEVWRVLKPGGRIHVRTPYALSTAALSDPTHTRYMTPATLAYLVKPKEVIPFDNHLPFDFDMPQLPIMRICGDFVKEVHEGITEEEFRKRASDQLDFVDEIQTTLVAIK